MKTRLLLTLTALLLALSSYADGTKINGIHYELDYSTKTAEVTYTGRYYSNNTYSGSITIPASVNYSGTTYSVTSIGGSAFYGCTGLTSITIPSSVTSIGNVAFYGCTGLTSITIPSSVTSIGQQAFDGCTGLTSVNITDLAAWCNINYYNDNIYFPNSNPLYYAKHLYLNGEEVTQLIIPSSVTSIRACAFTGCTGLTSITIPSSVTSIGGRAFADCTGLTSVTIPSSVTSIGASAFANCTGLTSVTIPSSVTNIGDYAFYNCTGLTSITIPSSVTSIGGYAFAICSEARVIINSDYLIAKNYDSYRNEVYDGGKYPGGWFSGVKEVELGENVHSIGDYTFYRFSGKIIIPNTVKTISSEAFGDGRPRLYINRDREDILDLWDFNEMSVFLFDIETNQEILRPTPTVISTTQSKAQFKIENYDERYIYILHDNRYVYSYDISYGYINEIENPNSFTISLAPQFTNTFYLLARRKEDTSWRYINGVSFKMKDISPTASATNSTPSTVTLTPSYIKGDANVTSQKLTINGTTQNVEAGKAYTITGLNPGKEYPVVYTIVANGSTFTYNGTAKTPALTMTTQQPKVISAGNVIVAAETNLDEAETNVGFEWRRTDWTDDFASNSGIAYLYGGTMEGYIRNLYTEKLWKYRPYYEASDGTRYYGDWVGLDPTNTSYFEPTVHTYATINVQSNTASVKGYAMRGTDNVAQQGFKYWNVSSSTRGIDEAGSRLMAVDIPAHAQTITASGQVMTATLTNLEYASDYCCVAFVTTTEGETFYGELQTFRTGEDVTGIGHVVINPTDEANGTPTIVGYYNLQGQRLADPQPGIVIVRYSDGTSRKMYVR